MVRHQHLTHQLGSLIADGLACETVEHSSKTCQLESRGGMHAGGTRSRLGEQEQHRPHMSVPGKSQAGAET